MSQSPKPTSQQPTLPVLDDSTAVAHNTVSLLLGKLDTHIQQQQLLSHLPQYLYSVTVLAINEMFDNYNMLEPEHGRIGMEDEGDVWKIPMESMAPKELRKSIASHHQEVEKTSPSSKPQTTRRLKRREDKKEDQSENGLPRRPKKPVSQVIPLPKQEEDQYSQLATQVRRQKAYEATEAKRFQDQIVAKQKRLQQERQKVVTTFANGYTFDLDGSVLKSELVDTDKMNVHVIRLNLKRAQNLKGRDPGKVQQQNVTISTSKTIEKDKSKTLEITGPQKQPLKFLDLADKPQRSSNKFTKMRKEQYSLIYGNRYNPWNERPTSKSKPKDKDQSFETLDFVVGKRHGTITSNQIDKSPRRSRDSSYMPSGFTLPKLKGRYNLLERYSSLDTSGAVSNAG